MRFQDRLAQMRELIRERTRLVRCIERAREAATGTGGSVIMRTAGDKTAVQEDNLLQLAALQADLEELTKALDVCREGIRNSIDRLPAGVEHTVLRMRYIQYMPAADIARSMHYTRPYVYKLLERAEGQVNQRTTVDNSRIVSDTQAMVSSKL